MLWYSKYIFYIFYNIDRKLNHKSNSLHYYIITVHLDIGHTSYFFLNFHYSIDIYMFYFEK